MRSSFLSPFLALRFLSGFFSEANGFFLSLLSEMTFVMVRLISSVDYLDEGIRIVPVAILREREDFTGVG